MRCESAQRLLSAALDGAGDDRHAEADAHARSCAGCAAFAATATTVRRQLRVGAVGDVPDIAGRVVERLERSSQPAPGVRSRDRGGRRWPRLSRRRLAGAAAVFLVGFVTGAVLVGSTGRAPVMAAPISQRALRAQTTVQGLTLRFRVTERGWHPDVPVRTYDAVLGYRAPERLDWRFDDTTRYPSRSWVENDGELATGPDATWSRGVARCPVRALPECTPAEARARITGSPEPFSGPVPAALDLVVPVRSFTPGGPVERLGRRTVAGRAAVGVAVTAAQVEALLGTLTRAGNWRGLHPADRVELWLDDETLVPLALRVLAAGDPVREEWALASGYDDALAPILELTADAVGFRAPPEDLPLPAGEVVDAGFRAQPPGEVEGPTPAWLPPGMRPYRAGVVQGDGPDVAVRTWTDGRAWVKVRSTTGWSGRRLFGVSGAVVQRRDLGAGGTVYAAEGATSFALHGDRSEVVVTGSVSSAALERVVASLGVRGRPVPDDWAEASTATLEQAAVALPGVLALPQPAGFAPPAVRIDGPAVVQVHTGPGARGFVLTQTPRTGLGPPLDADVRAVTVRGIPARFTPVTGRLEWVEDGTLVGLESESLPLAELAAVAEGLRLHRPPGPATIRRP